MVRLSNAIGPLGLAIASAQNDRHGRNQDIVEA